MTAACPFFRVAVIAAAALVVSEQPAPAAQLAGLGTNNFTVLIDTASYSQNAANLTLNSPFGLGDLVGGQFASIYNWSGITSFGLLMSAADGGPNAGFTIEFYDASLENRINSYQGVASGLTSTPTAVPVTLSSLGTGDLSSVGGFQFTWDGSSPEGYSGSLDIAGIDGVVVPELSTWALLAFSAALAGLGHAWRRHKGNQA